MARIEPVGNWKEVEDGYHVRRVRRFFEGMNEGDASRDEFEAAHLDEDGAYTGGNAYRKTPELAAKWVKEQLAAAQSKVG